MLPGRRDDETVKRTKAGVTPAVRAATDAGVLVGVHSYAHDPGHPSYALEAAEAMGVEPERVFKTLVADVDGRLVVGLVPVSGQLDLKALAGAVGGKRATMADLAAAERSTGYVRGGISPLGQRKPLTTVVDRSATDHDTIVISGGRRGLSLELAPAELIRLTGARTAAIGRG